MSTEDTQLHPQIIGKGSGTPLSSLIASAVRQFGDTPSTVDGNTILMLVEFANEIVDDIRQHPYSKQPDLEYYTHPTEVRDIDDQVIVAGLIGRYAVQQVDPDRGQYHLARYYKTLNQSLYRRMNGNSKLALRAVDQSDISKTTGQPISSESSSDE